MNEIKTFNSGRRYTVDGQLIAWTVVRKIEDGEYGLTVCRVSFADASRMVDGVVDVFDDEPTNADVLAAYDRGGYDWDTNRARVAELYKAAATHGVAFS